MVQTILRFYSYVLQLLVSLAALALGVVAAMSENKTFEIDMLPWSGSELRTWLLGIGIVGAASTYLAFKGKYRILFLLFALGTTFLLGRGIFASSHQFDGDTEFKYALGILAAFLLSVYGAWSRFRQPVGR